MFANKQQARELTNAIARIGLATSPAPRNSHPSRTRFYASVIQLIIQLIQSLILSALTAVQPRCTLGSIDLNRKYYTILFHLSIVTGSID
ncbi:MAG: hypothetical protein HC941_28710 [Microcoleus sp. SU_5_3]|nr:hypothetical protein [Microcoleus sp. SU_5_3]